MQYTNPPRAHRASLLAVAIALCVAPALALADPMPATCAAPAQEFAPGQVSTPDWFESRLAFTPSRDTIYWAMTTEPQPPGSSVVATILTANRTAGGWTAPAIASFSGVYSDSDPFVTPYGERMYFSSNRPGGVLADTPLNDIWIADRTASGWGVPYNAGAAVNSPANELYASADVYGNLYFASDRDGGQWDLYRARRLPNGSFAPAQKLPGQPNHPNRWEFNPEISPDGRTLLFATYGRPDSYGDVDIYVSHLDQNGNFGRPLNLGPCVNTAAPEFHPTVLWDRNELYFVRVNATTDFYVTPLKLP
jgi:Tol biopolymer transport system component